MQEKPSTTFLGLFFIFLFFINQFSLFFSTILQSFQVILYILSPHYSLINIFFAYHSLISIKNGHYFLISKPHPDPHALYPSDSFNGILLIRVPLQWNDSHCFRGHKIFAPYFSCHLGHGYCFHKRAKL